MKSSGESCMGAEKGRRVDVRAGGGGGGGSGGGVGGGF